MGFAPQVFDADQALRLQPRVGHGLLHRRGPPHVPIALAADGGALAFHKDDQVCLIAWCALRPGRKPKLESEKLGSKIVVSTLAMPAGRDGLSPSECPEAADRHRAWVSRPFAPHAVDIARL